nr:hypothetical protein [Pedobacter kyonggii]
MVDKVEFSDIYKFSASIAIILIVLSFVVPWFINHDLSFVMIKYENMHDLTADGRSIVVQQQKTLMFLNKYIIWFSTFLFISGSTLLYYSLKKWSARQLVLDSIQDEELRSKQIQNMTIDEKKTQIIEENIATVGIQGDINIIEGVPNLREEQFNEILDIENRLFQKISDESASKYTALQNVKVDTNEYDILLQSKYKRLKDRIVEIRYFNVVITKHLITNAINKTLVAKLNYNRSTKRNVIAVLIIVINEVDWEKYYPLIVSWHKSSITGKHINIAVVKDLEIESLDLKSNGIISKLDVSF